VAREEDREKVPFYAVDVESTLVAETFTHLCRNTGLVERIQFIDVYADIAALDLYPFVSHEVPKFIMFTGGSLGNFDEEMVLGAIRRFISLEDYLLLGVEYHTPAFSDEFFVDIYNLPRFKKLALRPIEFLVEGGMLNNEERQKLLTNKPLVDEKLSKVSKAKSLVYKWKYVRGGREKDIVLYRSTKYDKEKLFEFLSQNEFEFVKPDGWTMSDSRYGEILLKRKN